MYRLNNNSPIFLASNRFTRTQKIIFCVASNRKPQHSCVALNRSRASLRQCHCPSFDKLITTVVSIGYCNQLWEDCGVFHNTIFCAFLRALKPHHVLIATGTAHRRAQLCWCRVSTSVTVHRSTESSSCAYAARHFKSSTNTGKFKTRDDATWPWR
jgi:hypothetical protein